MSPRQRRRQRRNHKHNKLLVALLVVLSVITAALVAAGSWVVSVANKAPDPDTLQFKKKGQNSIVYAGDGTRLGYIRSDQARKPVSIKRVPTDLQYATVAIEDERFFDHNGVDAEGVVRAGIENIDAGKIVQGGSTITMQLMRNLYITDPKRDIERKIEEAKMALEYEQNHSKREILARYLNNASYGTIEGRTAVGVQAAAKTYFSKPVWKLNLEQSALIAGLPQAPSEYNPFLNPTGARERRNEVLKKMADLGYISKRRAVLGYQRDLMLNRSNEYTRIREPYFFDYVENKLIDKYGVNTVRNGGLKIYTTIDPKMQEAGRQAIDEVLYYPDDPASAVVAIDPRNGYIKAMASSGDYNHNQYNLAAQGHRQPGSAFKTFVLTTAIKRGVDPYSTFYTSKPLELDTTEWGHWSVVTYGESYSGTMDVAAATLASDNTVYAQLDLDLGPEEVAATAKSMGITTELDGIPAEGLGGLRLGVSPLEMSDAYATLASGGIHHPPIAIRKVEFPSSRVDHPEKPEGDRVLTEAQAYEVTKILNNNITGGTGTGAYTGCSGQAGKTGTTDNFNDAWFAGYQPNLSAAVWVGYPNALIEMSSVHGVSVAGGTFPADIWNNFFVNAAVPCEPIVVPDESIEWAPFYGSYTSSVSTDTSDYPTNDYGNTTDTSSDNSAGGNDYKGYNPDLYAPGAGQGPASSPPKPAPAPNPPNPAPAPTGGTNGG
ncbi:MAG: transglycosylase domain-containing protein [Actinomycetota bacterium]